MRAALENITKGTRPAVTLEEACAGIELLEQISNSLDTTTVEHKPEI